ncbi:MAG: hypothetical protein AB7I04_13040 [Pseudomonadales bacterium]
MSLVARYLESHGMPTVIVGSALDIVEHCGVPRFLFVDFPLGNPCGRPWDTDMQRRIVRQAVGLFESVRKPQTTVRSDEWWGDDAWRRRYMEINDDNRAELARKGEELRRRRANRERRPE